MILFLPAAAAQKKAVRSASHRKEKSFFISHKMSAEKQRKAYAASENRSVSVIRILDCQLPVTIIVFKFICVDWTNQTFSNRIEGNWMTEVQPGILKAKLTLKCFGFFRTIQKQKNLRMSDFNLGNRNLFFHKNSLKNLILIKLYRSIHLFARKSQMLLTALH